MSQYPAVQIDKAKRYMQEGIYLSNTCRSCGKPKNGKGHPKCSRKLKKLRDEGKI